MNAYINSISYFLPSNIRTNEDIAKEHPEWSVDKIVKKLGISERHIINDKETASDLAYKAALKLFEENDISRADINYVLFCTQSPDYILPTTACVLQNKLNLTPNCGALDYNLGCSGYIYGLGLAKGLILSKQAKNILLLTGETYSKYISKHDKSNKTIFGDAGTATLISDKPIRNGLNFSIGEFSYGTDGSKYSSLIVKNGATRNPIKDGKDLFDEEGNFISNDNNLFMNGKDIFDFTSTEVPKLVYSNLIKNNLTVEDIDLAIFHQANRYMLKTTRQKCQIPEEKFFFDINDVGNTVSNSIPIALVKAKDASILDNTSKVLLCGFGVGLSMGATIITK